MLRRIKKSLFPMNSDLENLTLLEYKKIQNVSISIYLITIQIVYCYRDIFNKNFIGVLFSNNDIKDFILGIIISATTFSAIYFVVLLIWQRIWISSNKNTCYLEGTWYHVFGREVDKNKNYVRAGIIEISQNFYDISVNAYNYDIYIKDGTITYDPNSFSNWYFSLCELKKEGKIEAKFLKVKEYSEALSNSGIMMLSVYSRDYKENIKELVGVFSDSGSSTVKGNIRVFKATKATKKQDFDFLDSAPDIWKQYIYNQLKSNEIPIGGKPSC